MGKDFLIPSTDSVSLVMRSGQVHARTDKSERERVNLVCQSYIAHHVFLGAHGIDMNDTGIGCVLNPQPWPNSSRIHTFALSNRLERACMGGACTHASMLKSFAVAGYRFNSESFFFLNNNSLFLFKYR